MSNILWTTWYIIAVIVLSGECMWLETRNFQKHPVPENVLLWEGGKLPAHKAKICVTFVHQQGVQWKDMPCHVYPNAWNLPIHAPCVFICWACYQHWLVPWTNLGNLPYVTILMIALCIDQQQPGVGSCLLDEFQPFPSSMNWSFWWVLDRI